MPFTTDQADVLIAIIQSTSGDAKAIADLPHQLITALKKVNTLDEKTRKRDTASQIAMERVQDCLRARLEKQEISLSAAAQASIDLLFAIHLADDVNTDIDPERRTLLERALLAGDVAVLRLLSNRYRVQVNAQDENGNTLLHRMLQQRNYAAARLLVEICHAAINIPALPIFNIPPLPIYIVVEQGNTDMAEFLIGHGACASEAEKTGFLDSAAHSGHLSMVKLFMQQVGPLSDAAKAACFSKAVEHNRLDVVKFLVEKMGADVNKQDDDNESPLNLAVEWGGWEVFEYLMSLDQLAKEKLDIDALMVDASSSNSSKILRFLIENNPSAETEEIVISLTQGLLNASFSGDREAITFWMKRGASPHGMDSRDKQNVLHAAAEGGHREIVQFWLEHEVDLSAIDSIRETVLHKAVRSGNVALVEALFAEAQKERMDVNTRNDVDQTPLDLAASRGDLAMVKCLLPKSPRFNAQGEPNFSHLVAAAKSGHLELVLYLLEQTDLEARDQAKGVALRAAIAGVEIPESRKNAIELVRLLLKRGATLPQDAEVPAALRSVVKDYSSNPAAAQKIYQAVSKVSLMFMPSGTGYSGGFPAALWPTVLGYSDASTQQQEAKQEIEQQVVAAEPLPDITIRLVEKELRALAREIDNSHLAATREERLEKLEAARAEVIAVLGDAQLRAECNLYWKQLKNAFKQVARAPTSQSASSASSALSNNFDDRLKVAFAAIPTPSTTYVPPPSLAPLVSMAAQPVDASKRERKESKEELESAPLTPSPQSAMRIDAPMPAVQTTSSSSSSSSSSSQQPPAIQRYPNQNTDRNLAGFSWAQIQAARKARLDDQKRGYKPDEKGRGKQERKEDVPPGAARRKRKDGRKEEHEQPVNGLGAKSEAKKKGKNAATAAAGNRLQDSAGPAQWESDAAGVSTKEEESEQGSAKGYALQAGHFGKRKAKEMEREPSNGSKGPTKAESDLSSRSGETAESEPVPKKPKDENGAGPSKK